jgi:dynein heavy chain
LGKLKSFLTLVKLEMQDTVKDLVLSNFSRYVDFIDSYIPQSTDIESITDVSNTYEDGYVIASNVEEDFKKTHTPLFSVNLRIEEGKIKYQQNPMFFRGAVLNTFSKTLLELASIPDIESKILDSKFKKRVESYLNCPRLPEVEPQEPDSAERPKQYVSQDLWVWELYNRLEILINKAIAPLDDYLK